MFQQVSAMNEAFGNPKGDPYAVDGKRLLSQLKNIPKETQELFKAMGVEFNFTIGERIPGAGSHIDNVRDALCDHMVFILGAYHLMGYDADKDMTSVVTALYSRFCKDEAHLDATVKHYQRLGIEVYVGGEFPHKWVKSTKDQGDGEYPKDKFLKALGYHTPEFYVPERPVQPALYHPLQQAQQAAPVDRKFMGMPGTVAPAPSVLEETAKARELNIADFEAKTKAINAQVQAYRDKLEREVFGFEPFTDGDGQVNVLNPVKPKAT